MRFLNSSSSTDKPRRIKYSTVKTAIEKAIADANHPMEEETVGVLITGSVITVGEARGILKEMKWEF